MKHSDTSSNERRNNKDTRAKNGNKNSKTHRSNTTNIIDDIVEVRRMFEECPGSRTEHQKLTKFRAACRSNVHRSGVNELRYIEINDALRIYCTKACRSGFPAITLYKIAELDKRQCDED